MERLRRTMMFVPGANAAMLRDAPLYGADSVMFDLEDAVSLNEKDSARTLVHFALKPLTILPSKPSYASTASTRWVPLISKRWS